MNETKEGKSQPILAAVDSKNDSDHDDFSKQSLMKSVIDELQVDRNLLVYKAFYFLFFAGFGASFPYMALYFKQIGLSASLVGILAGIRPIIQFISGPFWAILADTFKARKAVLLASILSWLVMTLALLIPTPKQTYCFRNDTVSAGHNRSSRTNLFTWNETKIVVKYDDKHPLHRRSETRVQRQISVKPLATQTSNKASQSHDEVAASSLQKIVYNRHEVYQVFIWLLVLIVVGEFLEAPTFIMADTALLQKLGEKQKHYGKTRLFGSLGFAFASFLVGALLDTTEYKYCGRTMNNYNVLFYTFAVVMALAFFFAAWLFEFTYEENDNDKNSGVTMETLSVFVKFQYAFFLTISFFLGFTNGLFFNFLNWYLEDLGASKLLMGTATFFRAVALMIAYIFNALLTDLCGHVTLMLVSVGTYFVLFGSFSIIVNPMWALPLEFLEGLAYGTTWSTAVTHLADVTPKGGAATMQGILQGVYWGLGGGLGAIIGGALIEVYGAIISFRLGAILSIIVFLVSGCIQVGIHCQKRKTVPDKHQKELQSNTNVCTPTETRHKLDVNADPAITE